MLMTHRDQEREVYTRLSSRVGMPEKLRRNAKILHQSPHPYIRGIAENGEIWAAELAGEILALTILEDKLRDLAVTEQNWGGKI